MEDQQGLLEFGTSVSVNDELRRTLVSEAEELKQSIETIKHEIGVETEASKDLAKTQAEATRESEKLHRWSHELHESLSLSRSIFQYEYHNTLLPELTLTRAPTEESKNDGEEEEEEEEVNPTGEVGHKGDEDDVAEESKDENKSPQVSDKIEPMKDILATRETLEDQFWDLVDCVKHAEMALEKFKNGQNDAMNEKKRLIQRVQELQMDLSKSQETTRTFSDSRQDEESRRLALENNLCAMKSSYEAVVKETKEKVRHWCRLVSTPCVIHLSFIAFVIFCS